MNLYAYVGNGPVNMSDPSGLAKCTFPNDNDVHVCGPSQSGFSPDWGARTAPIGFSYSAVFQSSSAHVYDSRWGRDVTPGEQQNRQPACKSYERQDRRWGDALTSLGQKVAAGGYLAAGVSAIGGGIGIATADPALAYFGGVGFSDSLATIAIGNGLQSLGALLNGAGGNGTPVTRDFVNDRVADLLKGAPSIVKDLVKQGLDRAEDAAGLNMPQTCRMGQ